jgi:hypothetical protein
MKMHLVQTKNRFSSRFMEFSPQLQRGNDG